MYSRLDPFPVRDSSEKHSTRLNLILHIILLSLYALYLAAIAQRREKLLNDEVITRHTSLHHFDAEQKRTLGLWKNTKK